MDGFDTHGRIKCGTVATPTFAESLADYVDRLALRVADSANASLVALATASFAGCAAVGPTPGTPEFTAAQVSRAYDCGLRIDRSRIIARLPAEQRSRFVAANASYAVKSYNAPRRCETSERERLERELRLGSNYR